MNTTLIEKYNVAGPRYTSYPTVPYWNNDTFSLKKWKKALLKSYNESNKTEGISLYIHLPFCESLCTFCGCNKRITKRHEVEEPYINAVLKEWELYRTLLAERPIIKEIHIGGGTPTFFSVKNLRFLLNGILKGSFIADNHQFSFEGHPNNTTKKHLELFKELGFTRVCYGVQDYNETVQKAIHRIQPFENVKRATQLAREIGYTSVGHDIIYGLPLQTESDVINTITKTKELLPDRIAFYSYAHVPWIKGNGQRGFKDTDLPSPTSKRNQYTTGKSLLTKAGYKDIGMDHFSLPTDNLYKASISGKLHRNFMGYSPSKTQVMIGLGVSSIGDSWYAFGQNVKSIEVYYDLVSQGIFPVYRGHILTKEDLVIRKHILNLMCNFKTSWNINDLLFSELSEVLVRLQELESDALIKFGNNSLTITAKGKPYVRNICMAFDLHLHRNKPASQLFSMTV